jgi:hypothetical protein
LVLSRRGLAARAARRLTSCGRSATGAGSSRARRLGAPRVFSIARLAAHVLVAISDNFIGTLAATIGSMSMSAEVWCVFDNTASGAAIENAWAVRERVIAETR